MEKQWTLEKLGGQMYRIHNKWDGTSEMLDWLKENGFAASSDGSDDYYHDFEEDNDHFNFGASMSECFQVLSGNQYFYATFILELVMGNKDARFGKQLVETIDPIDLLFPLIRLMRIDNFMYLIARNYNKSLGDQAKEMYKKQDEDGLITWMKGVVKPRFSGNVTPEEIRQYLVIDENPFKDVNCLDAFYDSWCCVKENMEAFRNWIKVNEIPMKNPAEIFNDCFLRPNDETTKMFALYYWFGDVPCACHLFSMLNSQNVSIGVKSLLQDTLTDYGKGDAEFARQFQHLYDGYKSLADWKDITFDTTATTDTAQLTPQASEPREEIVAVIESKESEPKTKGKSRKPKYERFRLQGNYLGRDTVDIGDLKHCDGLRQQIIKKGDKSFQQFIQGVAKKFHYIDDDPITKFSFAYALTGCGFEDNSIVIKVKWHHKDKSKTKNGPRESLLVLLYISKHMFDSTSGTMYTQLFDALDAGTNPYGEQSSSYAEGVPQKFREFFISCFGDI